MSDAKREERRLRDLIETDVQQGVEALLNATHVEGLWYVSAEAQQCHQTCSVRGLACNESIMINESRKLHTRSALEEVFRELGDPCESVTMQNSMQVGELAYLPARRIDGALCEGTSIQRDPNAPMNGEVCLAIPPAGVTGFEQRLCFCVVTRDRASPMTDRQEEAEELSESIMNSLSAGQSGD